MPKIQLPNLIISYKELGEAEMIESILIKDYGYINKNMNHLNHYQYTYIHMDGTFNQTNSIDKRVMLESVLGYKYISSTDFIKKYALSK